MKTIFNIDKIRICLLQPEGFYDSLFRSYHDTPSRVLYYSGYYLSFEDDESVNDKDITAKLFLNGTPDVELGTFTFNKSQKYGSKCFFAYATKSLYEVAGYVSDTPTSKYNYFVFPFGVFDDLGLVFNNVSSLEIACDTEAGVIRRIQYAVSHPEKFDMVLLWKKVTDPNKILDGFWEYYQRSRLKKAPRPSLYIHSVRYSAGNDSSLTVYDKARELAQSRKDKEVLVHAWNGMGAKIERMEISVENKQFKRFFERACATYPGRWLVHSEGSTTNEQRQAEYRQGIEHFFWDLGQDDEMKEGMFDYFANHLLHFKLKNREKTQVSILDLSINSLNSLQKVCSKKRKL